MHSDNQLTHDQLADCVTQAVQRPSSWVGSRPLNVTVAVRPQPGIAPRPLKRSLTGNGGPWAESKQDRPYDVQCSTRNCRRSRLRCCIGRDDVADVVPGQVSRAERGVCGSLRHRCCHRLRPTSMAGLGHRPDFGLLLSLPSAIITKAYAPVLVVGALGGLIIGGVIHGWLP